MRANHGPCGAQTGRAPCPPDARRTATPHPCGRRSGRNPSLGRRYPGSGRALRRDRRVAVAAGPDQRRPWPTGGQYAAARGRGADAGGRGEAFGDRRSSPVGRAEFVMAGVADGRQARTIAETLETLLAQPVQAGAVPIRLGVRLGLSEARPHEDPASLLAGRVRHWPRRRRATARCCASPIPAMWRLWTCWPPTSTTPSSGARSISSSAAGRHPHRAYHRCRGAGPLAASDPGAAGRRPPFCCGRACRSGVGAVRTISSRSPCNARPLARAAVAPAPVDQRDRRRYRSGRFRPHLSRPRGGSGFPIARLTVEITETGLIRELDRAAQVLDTLRAKGVRVAIDDFGTGYSSLAYLTSLPSIISRSTAPW